MMFHAPGVWVADEDTPIHFHHTLETSRWYWLHHALQTLTPDHPWIDTLTP
ncbi:MAG: hypothetical protein AAGF95_28705 [Chloroflexota bacterium]